MTRSPDSSPTLAIVGGGFSGAALAYHLARRADAAHWRITVVEPRAVLGAGLAYSTGESTHRINVPAGRMSLDTGDPGAFERWLEASGAMAGDGEAKDEQGRPFPQRGLFGRYVHDQLVPMLRAGRIVHHRAWAERIERRPEGGFRVALSDGAELAADVVALACTHPLPAVPSALRPIALAPGFLADPYDADALANVALGARVLVVGNGLTAADVVVTLDRLGHRGPIVTLSRGGLRSRGHAPMALEPRGEFLDPPARSALALLRRIRREIGEAARDGVPWQAVIDAVRGQGQSLWQALPESERARLVRHLRSVWDVHRFRIAPQVEARLDRLEGQGRLQRLAASLQGSVITHEGLALRWRRRHRAEVETHVFDIVVNTTGPAHRTIVDQAPAASLHAAGLVRLDRVGLGLSTAPDGRALDKDDAPVPGLYIAGPLARGTFGELMGLPQVTAYAEDLAAELVRAVGRPAADGDTAPFDPAALRRTA
ncbi:FAD/NAD(P)-binding protein [Aureimonas sp. AU20]|uniref:FAD/NAD(P)-binding protein n=1 Tax=Aureimonas sp. AU20 TaxID=1349819 RepID=UPI00071EEA0B|nr:FAD/NAD(P)-binding protein [Aureimonas sp. AU20]ALN74743.1 hypothetical protein M673_18645 [Aureimonas sp. AU20]